MFDAKQLLAWVEQTPQLPWQGNSDPYIIWLTEIMLQQTTIATVSNRFKPWLQRFPTLACLALATEEEVMHAWEGLGYYSRAKNLHRCAILVNQNGWPTAYQQMLKLPGIGDYTACALLSAFYNQPTLAVDANLKRIFMRLMALSDFTATDKQQWQEQLQDNFNKYGSYPINFALIRLGQLVCTAAKADCLLCPLQRHCLALQQGRALSIAGPKPKKITARQSVVLVLMHQQHLWVFKQEKGIGTGLYTLPRYPVEELTTLQQRYGTALALPTITHHYTRYNELLMPYLFKIDDPANTPLVGQWYTLEEIKTMAFLSSYRLIINSIFN